MDLFFKWLFAHVRKAVDEEPPLLTCKVHQLQVAVNATMIVEIIGFILKYMPCNEVLKLYFRLCYFFSSLPLCHCHVFCVIPLIPRMGI